MRTFGRKAAAWSAESLPRFPFIVKTFHFHPHIQSEMASAAYTAQICVTQTLHTHELRAKREHDVSEQ